MALGDQWLKELQKHDNQVEKSQLLQNLNLEAIAFLDESAPPLILPERCDTSYWNIVDAKSPAVDSEFLATENAAVLVRDGLTLQKLIGLKKVYFAPSVRMTPQKLALLANNEWEINFGLDVYSLGLWQSKLFRVPGFDKGFSNLNINKHKIFRLSSAAYEYAGANEIQELAIVLASLVQLIEDYKGHFSLNEVMQLVSFELAIGSNTFVSTTKVQALRLLLARWMQENSLEDHPPPPIFCAPSLRHLAAREPWNNIMRLTSMNMAAMMGGAQGIVNLPFDVYSTQRSKSLDGDQLARNTELILKKESFIPTVHDPSLGSYSLDKVVLQLCSQTWKFFQEIQRKEGLRHSLTSGWLQNLVKFENDQQLKNLQNGQIKMIGVNRQALFRSLSTEYPLAAANTVCDIETYWSNYVDCNQEPKLCDVEKLVPVQLSRFYEKWQFAADGLRAQNSQLSVIPVIVENGQEDSPKLHTVKEILSAAGLEQKIYREAVSESPVQILVSSDPDGEFAQKFIQTLRENIPHSLCLWAGEKQFPAYDGYVGGGAKAIELYERIFKRLGEI